MKTKWGLSSDRGGADVKNEVGLDVFDLSLWKAKETLTVWAKAAVSGRPYIS